MLALVAVLSFAGVVLVYVFAVRTAVGQELDDLAFEGRRVVDPQVTRATNDLLHSVTRSTLVGLTGAIVLFAVARRRYRLALVAGAAVTISVGTTELLKAHLWRPQLDDIAGIPFNSYPSGHATIAMSLSLAMVMVAPHRWRWLATLAAAAFALTFGTGVVATGWHRPSDAIGAFLLCAGVFTTATLVLLRWRGSGDPATRRFGEVEERVTPQLAALAGLVLVGTAALALVRTLQADGLHTVEFAADYVAVCLGILSLGVATVLGFHGLLRGLTLDPPRR